MTQTSEAGDHLLSFSDLALQPQSYSTTSGEEEDLSPSLTDSSPVNVHIVRSSASPIEDHDHVQHSAKTLADLALNNVTYDTILASTTKGLHLDLNAQYLHHSPSPLPSTDARAPPNTPASPQMTGYGSLASASAKIMNPN
jgi:hypothetical protein